MPKMLFAEIIIVKLVEVNMNNFYILSAGVSQLVAFLKTTQNISQIYSANDVSSLKDLAISQDMRSLKPSQVLFIISDTLPSADPNLNVFEFVRRVSGAGYQVIVVALSNNAIEIGRTFPQVKIVSNPIKINDILFTISSLGFQVLPADNPNLTIDVNPLKENSFGTGWSPPVENTNLDTVFNNKNQPNNNNWRLPEVDQNTQNNQFFQNLNNNVVNTSSSNQTITNNPLSNFFDTDKKNSIDKPNNSIQEIQTKIYNTNNNNSTSNFQNFSFDNTQAQNTANHNNKISLADFVSNKNPNNQANYYNPVSRFDPNMDQTIVTQTSQKRRGMVITVSVSKGGTGKSTLSLNLAAYLGSRFKNSNPGRTVCIIDTNYQQADTGKYLGQYTPNVVNLIKDPSLMTYDRITSALIHRSDMNFSALLGPATPDDALSLLTADTGQTGSSFSGRFYSEVLSLLKQHYDYIFIDTPVAEKFHSLFRDFALPNADYLIVPVIPSKQTVHNTYMWLNSAVTAPKVARGAGLSPEKIGIVLNRAEDGVGYGELEIMEELRNYNFLGSVPETKEWKKANNEGELIASKNKTEINEAFAKILAQVTGENLLKNIPSEYNDTKKYSLFNSIINKLKGN
jgi:MinD-like ATPase involved in chromosome partitioning or flagellar assembly